MNNVEYHHSSLNNPIPLYVLLFTIVPLYLLARLSALSSLTTNMACKAPGNQKNNVKIKFNIAWKGLPTSKTATGGKTTAKRYIISLFPPSIDFYNKTNNFLLHHFIGAEYYQKPCFYSFSSNKNIALSQVGS